MFKYLIGNLLRSKSLSEGTSLKTNLDRCLSIWQLFFYAVSAMAGAGIYVLAGHMIKFKAGPSSSLSFLFGGLASIFAGLCYSELSTLIPQAGSCYTFTYIMIGEFPAFIIGWTAILDNIVALSSVSKAFSAVVNQVSNDTIGKFTRTYLPISSNSTVLESSADIVAASLIILLLLISITGANISFTINSGLQLIQIICLSIVTVACFVYGSPSNYLADGGFAPFGISGIMEGASMAIYAYSGFECIANSAEEIKDPKRSIPIAIFSSLGSVIVMYLLITTGLSYMVPRLQIDNHSPFVSAFANKNLDSFKWIATVGTLIATGVTKLSYAYLTGRVIYAVAKDGLMFRTLGIVNETTKVPIIAILLGGSIGVILALIIKMEILADVVSMGILLSFISVGIDIIILRYTLRYSDINTPLKMRKAIHPILTSKKSFLIIFTSLLASILLTAISVIFILKLNLPLGVIMTVIFSFSAVSLFIILCFFEPDKQSDTFQTPIMPVIPIITVVINLVLLLNLPGYTWLRFFAWLIIGIAIYCGYGMWKYKHGDFPEEYYKLSDTYQSSYTRSDLKNDEMDRRM